MLLNSFFKINNISSKPEKTIVDVELNKNHVVFDGHFPGDPVVPGVFLIQMIKETIEVLQQKKFQIEKSDEIKFINMVIPQKNNLLTLEIIHRSKSENPYSFNVIISFGQFVFLKMKVDLAISE